MRLFISHSSWNNDRAIEVHHWLAKNGWDDVFLDLDPVRGIAAGQRWKEALRCSAPTASASSRRQSPTWRVFGTFLPTRPDCTPIASTYYGAIGSGGFLPARRSASHRFHSAVL